MIELFNRLNDINTKLLSLRKNGGVMDYRLYMSLSNYIRVFVKKGELSEEKLRKELCLTDDDELDYMNEQEIKEDYFMTAAFSDDSTLVRMNDTRRRMASIFAPVNKKTNNIPIVTFYSYKGGVGRSTAMASCASYLAMHHSKKIVILDCDFEAPGFTNFFLESPSSPINKEGLIEYLVDEATAEATNLSKYYWQVSKQFSGNGEIYVFPAGNLDESEEMAGLFHSHRDHYLNGLSRIDMFSPNGLAEQFVKLFSQIEHDIKPDVILIDSRTGFNDIYGMLAFLLSDLIVGFFGNNVQSQPGLNFFLDLLKHENAPRLLLVNSIIPATLRHSRITSFTEYVQDYLEQLSIPLETDETDVQLSVETFYVSSNEILNNIGSPQEDYRDFIGLINEKSFSDYNTLFTRIERVLEEINQTEEEAKIEQLSKEKPQIAKSLQNKNSELYDLKRKMLSNLKVNMPNLYAEDVESYTREYTENRYFYRNCMEDLFNTNKMLVIGNKGTGKTYIYKSLKEYSIVEELKKRANVDGDYLFLQAIDGSQRFDTIKFENSELSPLDYERFWTAYIWDVIMLNKPYGYVSSIDTFSLVDDTSTLNKFLNIINDDYIIKNMEKELRELDTYLSQMGRCKIVVLFDELDSIVSPTKWSERVAPLINFCKKMSYQNISPKLFVRSDLYEKTSGINNKNELKNRSITIEWNREELFAFFFKHLFSHSKEEFFTLVKKYKDFPNKYIKNITTQLEKNKNQPPLDPYLLRHLCGVFFGEYADANNNSKFGESYDWFFKNLQNSNGTLSLRPFIDLIKISVEQALVEDKTERPVLSPYYYTMGRNRAKAVEHHFDDLAAESGNEDLRPIVEYIRDHAALRFKRDKLMQRDFFSLLDNILQGVTNLQNNKDRDSIIRFLEINGIISQSHISFYGEAHKQYTFALLYKYYLGLRSKPRKRMR